MKNLILTAVSSVLLIVSSCRNEDSPEPQTPVSPIVGTWKMTKSVVYSGTNNAVLSTTLVPTCEANSTFQYTQDKKFVNKTYSEVNGNCTLDATDTGTYTYNESTKTLTLIYSDNTTESSSIQSLTSTEMRVIGDESDYNSDGTIDQLVIFLNK